MTSDSCPLSEERRNDCEPDREKERKGRKEKEGKKKRKEIKGKGKKERGRKLEKSISLSPKVILAQISLIE